MKNFLLTARNIIALSLICIVATLISPPIMALVGGIDNEMRSIATTTLMILLMIVGVVVYDRVACGAQHKTMLRFAGFNPTTLLWGLLLIISVSVIIAPLMRLLPEDSRVVPDQVIPVLYIIVAAPIFEELLFRAKIFSVLRSTLSPAWAAILSSLMFSVMHGNLAVSLDAFFVGIILSYIYILKGSLFAPILLHIMNNIVAYVMMSFSYQDRVIEDYIGDLPMFSLIYVGASLIALLGAIHLVVTLHKANRIVAKGGQLIELSQPSKKSDEE